MKSFITLILPLLILCESQVYADQQSPGYVIGWGWNTGGEATGVPSGRLTNQIAGTVTISGKVLRDARGISAGDSYSLALKEDGTVVGFGSNHKGQAIGSPPSDINTNGRVTFDGGVLSNIVAIAAGNFSVGLKRDKTPIAWGQGIIPAGLRHIVAIATRDFTVCAVKDDGTVVEWTIAPWNHSYGQALPVAELRNTIAVAVGGRGNIRRMVALRNDGIVTSWGGETIYKDATPPQDLTNVIAIAAGLNHTLALKKDGTVVGWGFNGEGQAMDVPTETGQGITNGLVTVGGNILTNVVAIAANERYSLALKSDGTVVGWGRSCPKIPEGLNDVVAISAGKGFCLAITTNKAVADRFSHR